MKAIALIDYGSGNLHSAARALRVAANSAKKPREVRLTADPSALAHADRIVLPGVGHFSDCAKNLRKHPGLIEALKDDELLNEVIGEGFWKKIKYYPTTTREESPKMGRITDLMRSGEAFEDLDVPKLNPDTDRAMICGNLAFNLELKEMLEEYGLEEGANSKPQHYVVEKAFLD